MELTGTILIGADLKPVFGSFALAGIEQYLGNVTNIAPIHHNMAITTCNIWLLAVSFALILGIVVDILGVLVGGNTGKMIIIIFLLLRCLHLIEIN